jgi:hypothetical protein
LTGCRCSVPRSTMRILRQILPVVVIAFWAPAMARAQPSGIAPRVAIVNAVELPPNLADVTGKLGDGLAAAVTQRGYELAPTPTSRCADHDCLRALASTGVTDVLVATGGRNEALGYGVSLRLWSTATEREDRAAAECNACSAAQMVDNVVKAAGVLLDRIPALHVSQAPVAAPASSPAVPTLDWPPPAVPTQTGGRSAARLAVGLSLIGLGVGTAAVGIWNLASNGDPTGCADGVCSQAYRTGTLGTVLTAGGAVLASAGVAVLLLVPDHPSTSVVIAPSGFSIGGTY